MRWAYKNIASRNSNSQRAGPLWLRLSYVDLLALRAATVKFAWKENVLSDLHITKSCISFFLCSVIPKRVLGCYWVDHIAIIQNFALASSRGFWILEGIHRSFWFQERTFGGPFLAYISVPVYHTGYSTSIVHSVLAFRLVSKSDWRDITYDMSFGLLSFDFHALFLLCADLSTSSRCITLKVIIFQACQ